MWNDKKKRKNFSCEFPVTAVLHSTSYISFDSFFVYLLFIRERELVQTFQETADPVCIVFQWNQMEEIAMTTWALPRSSTQGPALQTGTYHTLWHTGTHWGCCCFSQLPLKVTVGYGVPTGSPSRSGVVAVYVYFLTQTSWACPLLFILFLCLFLSFKALSTVFHSMNSPDNSLLSHSVLLLLFMP